MRHPPHTTPLALLALTTALAALTLSAPDAQAQRRPARVLIRCDTPSAQVWLNDQRIGDTPLDDPIPVKPGKHTLRIERPGFAPFTTTFRARRRRRPLVIRASLTPQRALLILQSPPHTADVLLDDTPLGTTPFEGLVPPGTHTLTLRADGRRASTQRVKLSAGHTYFLDADLQPSPPDANDDSANNATWLWLGGAVLTTVALTLTWAWLAQDDAPSTSTPQPDATLGLGLHRNF